MTRSYIEIINELEECLEKTCSADTVAFHLTITGTASQFEFKKKTKRQLDKEGISMRNIKGDFIK